MKYRTRNARPTPEPSAANVVYFNKIGEPIPAVTWKKLFGNPSYRKVRCDVVTPTYVVETTWIGLAFKHEGPEPKLFLTECYQVDKEGQRQGKESTDKWTYCLADANRAHGLLVRQIEKAFREGKLDG